jgi:GxxExxY protein
VQKRDLKHVEITDKILRVFFDVYNELGPGFLEAIYEHAMAIALGEVGFCVERQVPVPVYFRGQVIGQYKADLLVEHMVLLELKTAEALVQAHYSQLIHYLRATPIEVGMLLNFGPKPDFKRLVVTNEKKKIRVNPFNPSKSAVDFAL